jgi:hypothetical protein
MGMACNGKNHKEMTTAKKYHVSFHAGMIVQCRVKDNLAFLWGHEIFDPVKFKSLH